MSLASVAAPGARTLVVWCFDWPVLAAGAALDEPVAVLHANRVVACSPAAREQSVRVGLRRRDAQARCPELLVVLDDPAASARAFEPIVGVLEVLTPRLAVVQPGCVVMPTRGPSRYHGGDEALARRAAELVGAELPTDARVGVGVADGIFAAAIAARRAVGDVIVVPPDGSPEFLAPYPLHALARHVEQPELREARANLVDVLRRLGLQTLGDLVALPTPKVVGRFGAEGLVAQRLAAGLDPRPPISAAPPPDLEVEVELDPPAERVEVAAFAARGLAEELHQRLTQRGTACTQLSIGAETEHGEHQERTWRTDGSFGPSAIADRLRWQLDSWLNASTHRPTGGLTRLWLRPEEVVAAGGRQLSLDADFDPLPAADGVRRPGVGLGTDAVAAAERAARALARVQTMVGTDAVGVPEWRGGRGPAEQVALVPAESVALTEPRPAAWRSWLGAPWPGSLPGPATPTVVHPAPMPVRLLDDRGFPVQVSGRGMISGAPAALAVRSRGRPEPLTWWAGPWPCDERWWDPAGHRRRVRLQVLTKAGAAHLLILEAGRWSLEATYD